jgi:hypothetical protein
LLRLEVEIQDDRDLLDGQTVSAANFWVTVSSSFSGGTVHWHSLGSQEMQQVYRREEDRSTLFASCRSSSRVSGFWGKGIACQDFTGTPYKWQVVFRFYNIGRNGLRGYQQFHTITSAKSCA